MFDRKLTFGQVVVYSKLFCNCRSLTANISSLFFFLIFFIQDKSSQINNVNKPCAFWQILSKIILHAMRKKSLVELDAELKVDKNN